MNNKKYKPGLNYIELINQFWVANLEHEFTGNEAKLYFYLLHICNSLSWKNPFKQSLRQINRGTGISINSIKACQKRLVDAGLVLVVNGKAGNHFNYTNKTEYKIISVSKFDTHTDTHPDTDRDTHPDTINKLKETKQLFDNFRSRFPGTKRGLETEFKNFLKKNKPDVAAELLPALEKELAHRNELLKVNQFVPEWKNLSTWINKKCWEQEFPKIQPPNGKTQETLIPKLER